MGSLRAPQPLSRFQSLRLFRRRNRYCALRIFRHAFARVEILGCLATGSVRLRELEFKMKIGIEEHRRTA